MNFLKRFARNRGAVIGILILLAVIAFAILAPTLYPQSPWRPVARPFLAPFVNERFRSAPTRSAATSPRASFTARASR